MSEGFYDILRHQKVHAVYQPIVHLKNGAVMGYEALSRGPEGSVYYAPMQLIETAVKEDCLWELEMIFRQKSLEGMKNLPEEAFVFINVDPNIIKSSAYKTGMTKEYLKSIGADNRTIVFEITERTAITDYPAFQCLLENYKSQGYLIAMDDVGAGYSGLKTINEVRPNFIKIDMDLIRNIDKDVFKQALLKAFVDTAMTTNIKIIAEGIETKEELKTLIVLGVDYGQGYYLKKPSYVIEPLAEEVQDKIKAYNKIAHNLNGFSKEYHYISNLLSNGYGEVYEPMTKCVSIQRYFNQSKANSVCVCENNRPVGMVMKSKLDASMSAQYGYALFSGKPIANLMNTSALIVDAYTPIAVVAKRAMERDDQDLYDDIIVTQSGAYAGMVPMKKIIEYTLMYEKNNAREHNPLSGLPGNPIINRVLRDLVEYGNEVLVCYLDLNDFKVYNDVNGFEAGDRMICFVADLLKEKVKGSLSYTSFVGHIGGDDFVMVVMSAPADYEPLCQSILDAFEANKPPLFKADQLACQTIVAEDRFGVVREFPLTSLSIAGVYGKLSTFETTEKLTEALALLKKEAKREGRSHYIIHQVGAKKLAPLAG